LAGPLEVLKKTLHTLPLLAQPIVPQPIPETDETLNLRPGEGQ
jgi:hypothetical protein